MTYRAEEIDESVRGYGLYREFVHLQAKIAYELTDSLTLTSLTGYNDAFYSQLDDLDNFDGTSITNLTSLTNDEVLDYWTFPFAVERAEKDFSQELRLDYDAGGSLQLMAGVSYLDAETNNDLLSVANELVSGLPRSNTSTRSPNKAETVGVFGSIIYDVTDKLGVALEGRYQEDKVYAIAGAPFLTLEDGNNFGVPGGTFQYDETFFTQTFDNFLPRVTVDYTFSDNLFVYATWSKAANILQSSFNTSFLTGNDAEKALAESLGFGVIVQPEEFENFEVGAKGSLFDGRLTGSLAAYYGEWTNQHNLRSGFAIDDTNDPPVSIAVNGTANTGASDVYGIELDLSAEPIDGFEINFSGALNDSEYKSFADPSVTLLTGLEGDDFVGNQLPLSSKYSAVLGLQYTGAINEEIEWFIRGDTNYHSKQYINAANLNWIGERTNVDARIGVRFDSGVSAEIFAMNLLDDDSYISGSENSMLTPFYEFFTPGLGDSAYSYVDVALPELRYIGAKIKFEFGG